MPKADHVALLRRRGKSATYRHKLSGIYTDSTGKEAAPTSSDKTVKAVLVQRADLTSDGGAVRRGRRTYLIPCDDLSSDPVNGDLLIIDGKTLAVVNAPVPAFELHSEPVAYRIEVEG